MHQCDIKGKTEEQFSLSQVRISMTTWSDCQYEHAWRPDESSFTKFSTSRWVHGWTCKSNALKKFPRIKQHSSKTNHLFGTYNSTGEPVEWLWTLPLMEQGLRACRELHSDSFHFKHTTSIWPSIKDAEFFMFTCSTLTPASQHSPLGSWGIFTHLSQICICIIFAGADELWDLMPNS